jgi:myo-inositol 2-dehydrogenase / D-chiro-inositol 1-dehydrogenase
MIRFALIGAGFIGTAHARNLASHPGVELSAVHDADAARAADLAGRYGARAATDVDAVLSSPEIDAVLIASSTDTHADFIERAAAAGKAILCEKPIDLDIDRASRAVAAAGDAGVPAMVDFNRRFDESHAALHDSVAAGDVGAVEMVQMTCRTPVLPPLEYIRVSGGQMADQTVHFFDLLRWVTGDEPVEVFAMGSALADPRIADLGDVDTSVVVLRMRGGALAQIDSARRTGYGYDERIEVLGAKGMVESRRHRYRGVSRYVGDKVIQDGLHPGWYERMQASYFNALSAFVDVLERGDTPVPSLNDGLKAQLIAAAATESLRSGAPVKVHLP